MNPIELYTPRPHTWTFRPHRDEYRAKLRQASNDLAAAERLWGRDSASAGAAIEAALSKLDVEVDERDAGDSIGRERREAGVKLAKRAGDAELAAKLEAYDMPRRRRDGMRLFIKFVNQPFLPAPTVGLARTGRARLGEPPLGSLSDNVGTKALLTPFLPSKGLIVQLDLSQAELRVLAAASGCDALKAALASGDCYQGLADRLGLERAVAKQLTIAVTYGMGPKRVSAKLACSKSDAWELQQALLDAWPGVMAYKDQVTKEGRGGFVTSGSGLRLVPQARDEHGRIKDHAALNTAIQSAAADLLLDLLTKWVRLTGSLPCHTVHDSLVEQGDPVDLVLAFQALLASSPTWMKGVPLVGEVKWGRNLSCSDGAGVLTIAGFTPKVEHSKAA